MTSPRQKRANGEGTIYRRSNGRWSGQAYVTQTDGIRKRRSFNGATKREVQAKINEWVEGEERGRRLPPADLTLERYLREWLDQVVVHRVRPSTLNAYRFQSERYLIPDLGSRRLVALTARELRVYFESLKQRGVGARTVRYVHSTLRAALEDAMREELLEKNVVKLVRAPTVPPQDRHPLTVDETRTFLRSNQDDRLYALFVVIALLGLRRSEALGLRWDDVDLDQGALSVRRGLHRVNGELRVMETKTRRSRRTIPMPQLVTEVLSQHRARQRQAHEDLGTPGSGFVFTTGIGTPLDPDNTTKLVKKALKNAGVRDVRMHDFRHGCVSVLMGLGVPPRIVMEIAGHSGLEMTMNVYSHVSLEDKKTALDKLGDLFREEVE